MAQITCIEHDSTEHTLEVEVGYTVMQAALDNMIQGIVAECGGACSCATCHCYVDEAWVDKVGKPGLVESEMMEFAVEARDNSRLSCQLRITEDLDGLIVLLPASQY